MQENTVTAVINNFMRPEKYAACVKSLSEFFPPVNIIEVSDENLSRARNTGLMKVTTPYVLFGDDDFVYTRYSNLDALVSLMDIADIAGGKVADLMYSGNFHRAQGAIHYMPIARQFLDHKGVFYETCDFIPNFFLAKTEVVKDILWDESLRIEYEHIDFFLSAQEKGARVVFIPDCLVEHPKDVPDSPEYLEHRKDSVSSKDAFFHKWGFSRITDMQGAIILP